MGLPWFGALLATAARTIPCGPSSAPGAEHALQVDRSVGPETQAGCVGGGPAAVRHTQRLAIGVRQATSSGRAACDKDDSQPAAARRLQADRSRQGQTPAGPARTWAPDRLWR